VLRSVLTRGMTLAGVGVAAGLAGAAGMTRYFASMLFQITPLDARTYAAVAISFLLIAALACFVPAHRATRIDPVSALRE
jgi:putative ABC transport system permease protein